MRYNHAEWRDQEATQASTTYKMLWRVLSAQGQVLSTFETSAEAQAEIKKLGSGATLNSFYDFTRPGK